MFLRLLSAGIVLFAVSLLTVANVQAESRDILGVRPGNTPDEAKAALSTHRKSMQWNESKAILSIPEDKFLVLANALWGPDVPPGTTWGGGLGGLNRYIDEAVSMVFSTPPGDPKVIAVGRWVKFAPGESPTVEGLMGSLAEKFGPPQSKGKPSSIVQTAAWSWDKTGRPSTSPPCMGDGLTTTMEGTSGGAYLGTAWLDTKALQNRADKGCSVAVYAELHTNSQGVVDYLRMSLVDVGAALQAATATNAHVRQLQEARTQDAQKKASLNKPAL